MEAGEARNALLRVAERLRIELVPPGSEDPRFADSFSGVEEQAQADLLASEDEQLVAGLTSALARLADGLGPPQAEIAQKLVAAALDGAEMTMRGELMRGRCDRLPALMPSFVFLVALPIVNQDEAFELSQRTVELLEEERRKP